MSNYLNHEFKQYCKYNDMLSDDEFINKKHEKISLNIIENRHFME